MRFIDKEIIFIKAFLDWFKNQKSWESQTSFQSGLFAPFYLRFGFTP